MLSSITIVEAIKKLLECIKEWELSIRVADIRKEDWNSLLESYGEAVSIYHPENDHQERGAFLRNEHMLKKYGLTNEDVARLDFC